jgi:hypothetical protein
MPTPKPEWLQRTSHAFGCINFVMFNSPAECRSQVVLLTVQLQEPLLLFRARQSFFGFFREG